MVWRHWFPDDAAPVVVPLWEGIAVPNSLGGDSGVVRLLEIALDRAKRGELQSVGVVGVLANRFVFHEWAVGLRTRTELVGAVKVLEHALLTEWFGECERTDIGIGPVGA